MVFDQRLGILRGGNVISAEVENKVRRVISRLEDPWNIHLNEEQGGRMVTHLAMALMRVEQKEEILPPEKDLLEEFRDLAVYPRSLEIIDDLLCWVPMDLPAAEKDYMVLNICLILDEDPEP